ncbi:MAG TPA: chorismate mutase [Puia sp.]|nr:chorismate mutase [Puia sp.]
MKRIIFLLSLGISTMVAGGRAWGQTTASDPFLKSKRAEIDSLDKKLFEVLGERERVVKEIGVYKAKNNIPSLQAARFQQVLDKGIEAGKKEGLSAEFVTELLNAIHKESLRIEDALKANP